MPGWESKSVAPAMPRPRRLSPNSLPFTVKIACLRTCQTFLFRPHIANSKKWDAAVISGCTFERLHSTGDDVRRLLIDVARSDAIAVVQHQSQQPHQRSILSRPQILDAEYRPTLIDMLIERSWPSCVRALRMRPCQTLRGVRSSSVRRRVLHRQK